ncbi:hypothetical protein ACB092_12G104100 [Castanea dentata]
MRLVKVLTILFFIIFAFVHATTTDAKHYIVYMGEHSHPNSESVVRANHEILASITRSFVRAQQLAIHHYNKSFRGFSAMLTPEQAQQLEDLVVSVFQSKMNKLHTTHSWEFLRIDSAQQYNQMPMESTSNIIVGVIDIEFTLYISRIWPESKSFNDKGQGPVPKKFKGECVTGEHFRLANCNRKIIGDRFYSKGFEAESRPLESFNLPFFRSVRDGDGHGTYTASTIVGSIVANVSLFGMARGTARGGAPSVRLAIYKACWFDMCSEIDILSVLDNAISDGVDILSISIGPDPPQPSYFENAISIGAFHAFQRGILVSASAGNLAFPGTATNVAPWILIVVASSVDREFHSIVYLGNSKVLKGFSLNPIKMETYYGLIGGCAAAALGITTKNGSFCKNNTLDQTLVKGKIVAGAVRLILIDPSIKDVGFQFVIPNTLISQEEAKELQACMISENSIGKISPTITVLNIKLAPEVVVFSSIGPNIITTDIIKPDITGPGLNILAAWSPVATTTTTERSVDYNIISGTSMSCPHVSAVSAIVKSDPNGTPTTPFDYGSEHISPTGVLNPGLVYDFNSHDIINFLCSTGASPAQLKNLTRELVHCKNPLTPSYNLNYPSIGVANMNRSLSLYRTVTYYGKDPTVYVASIDYPTGVEVKVTPAKLKFTKVREKMSFRVDFIPFKNSNGSFVFGSLTWSNGIHRVRSPIGLNVVSM